MDYALVLDTDPSQMSLRQIKNQSNVTVASTMETDHFL